MLLDCHHHFDFLAPGLRPEFLRRLAEHGIRVVAQTLTPSSFCESAHPELCAPVLPVTFPRDYPLQRHWQLASIHEPVEEPLWSVGLHPWHLGSKDALATELEVFARAVPLTRFVGEVGLDFSPRRLDAVPAEVQTWVFERVVELACEAAADQAEPWVMSIHAVHATTQVLDVIERLHAVQRNVVPVIHRFGGTSDELTGLVRLGGRLSVHPQMLESKRGRAYVRQVPPDRLLLETDLPEGEVPQAEDPVAQANTLADEVHHSLTRTLGALDDLLGRELAPTLHETQRHLYGVQ